MTILLFRLEFGKMLKITIIEKLELLQQALSLQVLVSFFRDDVAKRIFELFVLFRHPSLLILLLLDLLPKLDCIFDLRDVSEMGSVGDAEAAHSMSVSPLAEVSLERLRAFVGVVATNLAVVVYVEAMQLVQPVWNRLAIPTQRQILGVVWDVIIVVVFFLRFRIARIIVTVVSLAITSSLLPLYIFFSRSTLLLQHLAHIIDLSFNCCDVSLTGLIFCCCRHVLAQRTSFLGQQGLVDLLLAFRAE